MQPGSSSWPMTLPNSTYTLHLPFLDDRVNAEQLRPDRKESARDEQADECRRGAMKRH
jgi:hypothetical protein